MRKVLPALAAAIVLAGLSPGVAASLEAGWTIALNPPDFVVGPALRQLHTRHSWVAAFDDRTGTFEIALRKTSVSIPAPKCRMDYLILTIPHYYPENPKQASKSERRAVYDALLALQTRGIGSMAARVEAPLGFARIGTAGPELTACNLLFALPLSVQVRER
jgi:hypothetical protein